MASIGLFTPIVYQETTLLGAVSEYLDISGGERAYVISGTNQIVMMDETLSVGMTLVKVCSYALFILPLIALTISFILRNCYTFEMRDVEAELQEGISPQPESLKNLKNYSEYEWSANQAFGLKAEPHLVFKEDQRGSGLEERWHNIVLSKKICLIYELNHLVVPHARLIKVENKPYIVEEKVDIDQDGYTNNTAIEPIQELALYVIKAKQTDTKQHNFPYLTDGRIALVDTEFAGDPRKGIFGEERDFHGLIPALMHRGQIEAVQQIAWQHGLTGPVDFDALTTRTTRAQNLKAFHEKAGITLANARTPIEVDIEALNLPLDEKLDGISFREVARAVVDYINEDLAHGPNAFSLADRREIALNPYNLPSYHCLGIAEGCTDYQSDTNLWIYRVILALVEAGHLFELIKRRADYFFLQA